MSTNTIAVNLIDPCCRICAQREIREIPRERISRIWFRSLNDFASDLIEFLHAAEKVTDE